MTSIKDLRNFFKVAWLFVMFVFLNSSCEKEAPQIDENVSLTPKEIILKDYPPEISFEVTNHLFEGKQIDCIEPNYNGNTWVASGNELFHIKDGAQKSYTLDYPIKDISIAGDENLWIATFGGGLACLSEGELTWYNRENSHIPRDTIFNVEVGLDGRIWFSSGAMNRGGLLVYDGKEFITYSPENSILNQHVIGDIEIDHDGSIYVNTSGKVGKSNVYRIINDSWEGLGGGFYWIQQYTVGPEGEIYLYIDYSLSSSLVLSQEGYNFYHFKENDWERLFPEFQPPSFVYFTAMKADRRNFCWAGRITGSSSRLYVYNQESWIEAPEELFVNDNINTIETDMDNTIWIGTAKNGVYIFNQ